jgi:hypothetical protein
LKKSNEGINIYQTWGLLKEELLTVLFKPLTNDAQKTFQKSKTLLSVYSLFPSKTPTLIKRLKIFPFSGMDQV